MSVSLDDQIDAMRSEVKRLKKFMPKMVEEGRMTQDNATLHIVRMQAVLETLTQLKGLAA